MKLRLLSMAAWGRHAQLGRTWLPCKAGRSCLLTAHHTVARTGVPDWLPSFTAQHARMPMHCQSHTKMHPEHTHVMHVPVSI